MRQRAAWRELLETIIRIKGERERIASELQINPVTLSRWASGESNPRPGNLRHLVSAVPKQFQEQLQQLLEEDLGALNSAPPAEEESPRYELPFSFIREILRTRTNCPQSLLLWTISNHVFQHSLRQFSPSGQGLAVTLVRCMPPASDGKIHSLYESMGRGTPPWPFTLEQPAQFLGADTLCGYAISQQRFVQVADIHNGSGFIPVSKGDYEVSAAACPLMHAGNISGCLLFSSTQAGFFTTEPRITLIQVYSDLLALSIDQQDFYPPDLLNLRVMPPPEEQQKYFAGFRQQVLDAMREPPGGGQPLNSLQARLKVLQDLEELILREQLGGVKTGKRKMKEKR